MAALKCRPGDLAYIASMHPAAGLNGHVVKLTDEPAVYIEGIACWQLESPVQFKTTMTTRTMSGGVFEPGRVILIDCLADYVLKPIRPQADDAVDEMVRRVGVAPITLTELREWRQAA